MAAAFLVNFLFWSGIAIGGIVFAALVDVTGGEWLGPMRGVSEQFRRFLPVSFVLLLLLLWRSPDVYPWARTPAPHGWFGPAAVTLRDAFVAAGVYACAFGYSRRSRRAGAAAALLAVYAVGFSILTIDLIMSLEPRWTSTLFPAYVFTGNVYAGAAAIAAYAAWRSREPATAAEEVSRVRDTANVLVGFALFWTYLFWSQFLVIWYGNVTAEVGFMMARIGTSRPLGWIVLTLCSAVPAILLVPQWGKRAAVLRVVAIAILVGLWLERWLLVTPALPASAAAGLVVTALFAGLFMLSLRRSPKREVSPERAARSG
jgi:hypothetical protein